MDLSEKTCMVTGANSGLGLATSKKYAAMGANVILVCRDKKKGETAIEEIKKEVPKARLTSLTCDLSSLESVQQFIREFKAYSSRLDVLLNNAAVLTLKRNLTIDGLELMFQTNYLAPFLITTSLLDCLKNSTPSQIINIAQPPEKLTLEFDNLQSAHRFSPMDVFMRSKLCLVLFTLKLARNLEGSGLSVIAGVPGAFKSDLGRNAPWPLNKLTGLNGQSADRAAENVVYLTTDFSGNNGKVYLKKQEIALSPYWTSPANQDHLWSVTEEILKDKQLINQEEMKQ